MASLDDGIGRLRSAAGQVAEAANAAAGIFAAVVASDRRADCR